MMEGLARVDARDIRRCLWVEESRGEEREAVRVGAGVCAMREAWVMWVCGRYRWMSAADAARSRGRPGAMVREGDDNFDEGVGNCDDVDEEEGRLGSVDGLCMVGVRREEAIDKGA